MMRIIMKNLSPIKAAHILCALACMMAMACGDGGDAAPDAGTDAMPPLVNLTYQQLQQACVVTGACGVQRYTRLKDCVAAYYKIYAENALKPIYARMYDCVNKAGSDCTKVAKCMGFAERPQAKDKSCDGNFVSRCDGNKAVTCDLDALRGGWIQTIDCSDAGLKCAIKNTGSKKVAICGGGTCNTKKYKTNCQGNKSFACVGDAIQINDCTAQAMQCRDPTKGTCEGTGRSWKDMNALCCKDLNPACSAKGDVLTQVAGGYLWQRDCAKEPGKKTCSATSNSCVGSGTECKEDSSFDTCDSDIVTLVTCVDGFTTKFNCQTLGFADGCKKADTGYGAFCRGKWYAD